MRVLMLAWELVPHGTGGLATATTGLARGLVQRGVDLTVLTPTLVGDEDAGGARVLAAADAPGAGRQPWTGLADVALGAALSPYGTPGPELARLLAVHARAAARVAGTGAFDVVHAHDWLTVPAALAASAAARVPFVLHLHSLESDRCAAGGDPVRAAIERLGIERAARVVCVSRRTANDPLLRARRADTRVVHNAVELPETLPTARRRDGPPVVLFLGRVTQQKDPATFLRSAALVAAARPDARFVLAGDGDLLPAMRAQARGLGLADRVRFPGFLRGGARERAYRRATLFALTSRAEPFGLTPLEAVVRGLPAVVSRGAGVTEIAPSLPTFPAGDARALADLLLDLAAAPRSAESAARRAAREALARSWADRAGELMTLYRGLAA